MVMPTFFTGLSDPMTTRGDIIIRNTLNVTARLGIGAANYVLGSDGTDISWHANTGTGNVVRATSPTLTTPRVGGNLDGADISFLANSGLGLIGWNRSAGGGELDFFVNRGAGVLGGFRFYDYTNAGAENILVTMLGSGNVGIGVDVPTGRLDIVDSRGVDDHPVRLTNNGDANFMQSYRALAPNLTAGRHVSGYTVGVAFSARNAAYLAFYYAGAGSTSNCLSLGLHSVDDALLIYGTGNVVIAAACSALSFTGGDYVFKNGCRLTESEDLGRGFPEGIALLSKDGKILDIWVEEKRRR